MREESGLEIHQPRYHGLLIFANFKSEDWYVWVFTADQFSGELRDSSEGRLGWIPDEALVAAPKEGGAALPLWPSDRIIFPWLESGRIFSARFQYADEVMLGHEVVFYGPTNL